MKSVVVLVMALMLVAPLTAEGEILLEPLEYDWNGHDKPPWNIRIDGCNFMEMVRILELRLQKYTASGLEGNYFLESPKSQWGLLRISVSLCHATEIWKINQEVAKYSPEEAGSPFLVLARYPKVPSHSLYQAGEGSRPIEMVVLLDANVNDKDAEAIIREKDFLVLSGLISWYMLDVPTVNLLAIRTVVIRIDALHRTLESGEAIRRIKNLPISTSERVREIIQQEKEKAPPIEKKEQVPQGCC